MVPSVLCPNDPGRQPHGYNGKHDGHSRAQMDGHPPLVLSREPELFENHGIDSRYTGPHEVAPPCPPGGTGGNNVPLISQTSVFSEDECADLPHAETYCIAGNIIDRQDHNGGNGIGVQPDISYTVTATDRHGIFSTERQICSNDVVSTQSARQYRAQTDLVADVVSWTAETV